MKNNIFKSFRFEVVLYSLLSLVFTMLTLSALLISIYLIYNILNTDNTQEYIQESNNINNSINYSLNNSYSGSVSNKAALEYNPALNNQSGTSLVAVENLDTGFVIVSVVITLILGLVLFITYFLLLTRKFVTYVDEIAEGITEISAGNFNTRVSIESNNEFALIAEKLNQMTDGIKQLIEVNRKNENTKNELITSVAHDLRTPLTSIIGYLDLVSDTNKLTEEMRKRYIEIAYSKSKRLEKLIEDLFAYTKFSFGEVTMELSEIDLIKLLNQLVDEFYPSFQESKLEYDFSTSLSSAIVIADGNLLARAFANLISNAIKYGKDGKSIRLRLMKEHGKYIISCINYGKLIPQKDLNYIFDRFYRVESSRSSETGGTGLGLAIAKSIIQMHGGTITARSDFDGTVFEVILNAKKEGSNR